MSYNLLFCVHEDAKPYVPRILALRLYDDVPQFCLVESTICPENDEDFKKGLSANEAFETPFIGASEEDCQKWTREKAGPRHLRMVTPEIIAIADARSAEDGTLLIKKYQPNLPYEDELNHPRGPCGLLPPREKNDTWWSYRVYFGDAAEALLDLSIFGCGEAELPYYGYKDRLTDVRGIFDVVKARRIMLGEDGETVLAEMTERLPT